MSSRMAFQVGDRFGKLVILRQDGVHKRDFIEWARKVTNHTVCLPMAEQWGGDVREDA